jgi:hypothetical protein
LKVAVLPANDRNELMKLLSEVTKDALGLPVAQRLTLARILLEVSEKTEGIFTEIEEAWEEEIGLRIEAIKSGTVKSKDFESAFKELDRLFPS